MYTIKIKGLSGQAYKVIYTNKGKDYTCYNLTIEELKQILPININDDFAEYSDLDIKGLLKGYTHFELIDNKLWTICEYKSKVKLTDNELESLAKETQGQWSDGIGESFEQHPCAKINKNEVYISPWFYGQELIIEQTEIS